MKLQRPLFPLLARITTAKAASLNFESASAHRGYRSKIRLATILLLASLAGGQAAASSSYVIPDATSSVQCLKSSLGVYDTQPLTCTDGGGSAQITFSPDPSAVTQATGAAGHFGEAALAQFTYYFIVEGGTAGTQVPLLIDLDLLVTGNSTDNASAQIYNGLSGPQGVYEFVEINTPGSGTSFSGDVSMTATAGSLYSLSMALVTSDDGFYGGSPSASIDSSVCVDPSFAGGSSYSIGLSSGIGNVCSTTSSTPEPSSWALVLSGLAGLGMAVRRTAVKRGQR